MISSIAISASNSLQHYSFVRTQLNGSKLRKGLNVSVWSIYGTIIGTAILDQSRPGSNGNKGVLHIPPYLHELSLTINFMTYQGHWFRGMPNPSTKKQFAYSTTTDKWVKDSVIRNKVSVVKREKKKKLEKKLTRSYVCMFVYIYIYIYVCVCVCARACVCVRFDFVL